MQLHNHVRVSTGAARVFEWNEKRQNFKSEPVKLIAFNRNSCMCAMEWQAIGNWWAEEGENNDKINMIYIIEEGFSSVVAESERMNERERERRERVSAVRESTWNYSMRAKLSMNQYQITYDLPQYAFLMLRSRLAFERDDNDEWANKIKYKRMAWNKKKKKRQQTLRFSDKWEIVFARSVILLSSRCRHRQQQHTDEDDYDWRHIFRAISCAS